MKKTLSVLLAMILLFGMNCAIFAQSEAPAEIPEEADVEEAEDEGLVFDYDELVVAATTPLTGNFLWGNAMGDLDVQSLIHGYDLVQWQTDEGMFTIDDSVVSGVVITEDTAGNQTYTIALYTDLVYSDGTPITSADYAFSTLLTMAPEMEAVGGKVRKPDYILGYEDYISGKVPYLAGFKMLTDDVFSITISADYLPFFYELGLLDCKPYPISEIAPGVKVADDGDGIYLTNIKEGATVFTADLLAKTVMDPETGYMSHPKVTSGPYKLVSYENGVAAFEINDYFKGDAQGVRPSISRLTYKILPNEDLIPAFEDGEIQLINKATLSETVQNGLQAIGRNQKQLVSANYPRTGFAYISFNTERQVVNEEAVRQAMAYQMNRDSFISNTVGNYGLRVDGYYGLGQWMYQLLSGAISYTPPESDDPESKREYEKDLEEWNKLSMDGIKVYEQNTEEALNILNRAEWNLNEQGQPFNKDQNTIRYKLIDGELVPLKLTLAYPDASSAVDSLKAMMNSMKEIGMEVTLEPLPMPELLEQYYGNKERNFDMFFLASNFEVLFDPSANFVEVEDGRFVWKETGFEDEELYEHAVEMRQTEAGDLVTYCKHWVEFQTRFAETLPMIPLYSNVYFDFYPRVLHDYNISSNINWAQAIVPAYMSDIMEGEAEESSEIEETVDEDGMIILGD